MTHQLCWYTAPCLLISGWVSLEVFPWVHLCTCLLLPAWFVFSHWWTCCSLPPYSQWFHSTAGSQASVDLPLHWVLSAVVLLHFLWSLHFFIHHVLRTVHHLLAKLENHIARRKAPSIINVHAKRNKMFAFQLASSMLVSLVSSKEENPSRTCSPFPAPSKLRPLLLLHLILHVSPDASPLSSTFGLPHSPQTHSHQFSHPHDLPFSSHIWDLWDVLLRDSLFQHQLDSAQWEWLWCWVSSLWLSAATTKDWLQCDGPADAKTIGKSVCCWRVRPPDQFAFITTKKLQQCFRTNLLKLLLPCKHTLIHQSSKQCSYDCAHRIQWDFHPNKSGWMKPEFLLSRFPA